ncbi:MAG: fumarylacetoacetate hydrolase family protein [Aquabacterium sp.]|jgi:2-keto-4-pentenoate hydratase/2-oxohepta-3-ene-1,7-dioic acid hydratase in catechol pathway|uniref:fumarylacetoacetate hydrolase family protein n=1 Tax=Aquabacterium sp. TaxID=1872578 RepID=UPI003BB0B9BE
MRLVSFQVAGSGAIEVGVLVGDEGVVSLHQALPTEVLAAHEGMPEVIARWAQLQPQVQALLNQAPHARLPELHLLAPVPRPPKLLAIGLNYLDHVNEKIVGDQGRESRVVPEHQLWFTKLGHAINGPYDDIVLPKVSERTDYEAELVAVIGQRCKHVPRERAHEVIFGYCVGNDVSVRDWQKRTSQWTLGKSFDTHAPFGPWLTTADELGGDPHALDLRCWVNGELRQQSNTSLMIHDVWSQIALLSQAMTLEPGDVIYTGTCSGVGAAFDPPKFLRNGDVVRVEIDKLGAIEARCVDEA